MIINPPSVIVESLSPLSVSVQSNPMPQAVTILSNKLNKLGTRNVLGERYIFTQKGDKFEGKSGAEIKAELKANGMSGRAAGKQVAEILHGRKSYSDVMAPVVCAYFAQLGKSMTMAINKDKVASILFAEVKTPKAPKAPKNPRPVVAKTLSAASVAKMSSAERVKNMVLLGLSEAEATAKVQAIDNAAAEAALQLELNGAQA